MRIAIVVVSLAFVACGGSSGSSGPTEAIMNITATGVTTPAGSNSPQIPLGGRIHFFNKDTKAHQITSACPELNETSPLAPGADDLRPVMNTPNNCGMTDSTTGNPVGTVTVLSTPPSAGGGGGAGY